MDVSRDNIGSLAERVEQWATEFETSGQFLLTPRSLEQGGNAQIIAAVLHQAADLLRLAFELKYPAQYFPKGLELLIDYRSP